ncbi:MAG: 2-dehydro-3-deoxyphosphogluconate aldolase, partial [Candidatus Omnitrophica bacterium]|nr:2-dehydro-3-deoxyphosphogluconate aldolase [Candidatus Omnitrophota bacterium]
RECVERKVHVLPGAFTPKEVFEAWSAGAALVKVFPASMLGPKYFKELKGPFNDVKLMAVGGVNEDNIGDYFKSGADAVAFGASVFKKEWIERRDYAAIGALVSKYVEAVKTSVKEASKI